MALSSLIVSIGLFILAMVVVFLLRASDQRTKVFKSTVKKLEQHESEIKKYDDEFKQDVAEVASTLREQTTTARELLRNIASELVELKSYSEDLGKLHSSMTSYQNSIAALVRLTEETDIKMEDLKNEASSISALKTELSDMEKEVSEKVSNLVSEAVGDFERTVAAYEAKLENISQDLKNAFEKANEASHDLEKLAEENIIPEPEPEPVVIAGVKVHEKRNNISIQDMEFDDDKGKENSGEIIFS